MSEMTFDPAKSKLHYQILHPGGYPTWFKDSERYHRSSGDWKWMEVDTPAAEDVEAFVSWKSLIQESPTLSPLEKRKELYEEEKVCGVIRMHTSCGYQEQTKGIRTMKALYQKLKELASATCFEAVESSMISMWSTTWFKLTDCESLILRYNELFSRLDDNQCTLPEGVYATALLISWPKTEIANKKMLLAQKKGRLKLNDVHAEMRQIANRALHQLEQEQDTPEILWTEKNTRKRISREKEEGITFSLGNRMYLDMMRSLHDVSKMIVEKWERHWGEKHADAGDDTGCRSDCWMNLGGEHPKIFEAFVRSKKGDVIPRKRRKM